MIPQHLLDTYDTISQKIGNPIKLSVSDDHQDNIYQWYKDGTEIDNATDKNYVIEAFSYEHPGNYWAKITNHNTLDLTLYRDTITLFLELVEGFNKDSLALVKLYNATNGSNWNNIWNLDDNVIQWHGVTITDGRVTGMDLSNNLFNNFLSETLPEEIKDLTNLQSFNLSNNSLENLPSLNIISNSTSINVSNNNLDFSSIIPNLSDESNILRDTNFIYVPQGLLDTRDTLIREFSAILGVSDIYQGNIYQWYKDGTKNRQCYEQRLCYKFPCSK